MPDKEVQGGRRSASRQEAAGTLFQRCLHIQKGMEHTFRKDNPELFTCELRQSP